METIKGASEIMSRKQASDYLSISKGTLDKLKIPRIKVRRRIVFKKADIDLWLESQKTAGGAQA